MAVRSTFSHPARLTIPSEAEDLEVHETYQHSNSWAGCHTAASSHQHQLFSNPFSTSLGNSSPFLLCYPLQRFL